MMAVTRNLHYVLMRSQTGTSARCLDVPISGEGATDTEALANLQAALERHFAGQPRALLELPYATYELGALQLSDVGVSRKSLAGVPDESAKLGLEAGAARIADEMTAQQGEIHEILGLLNDILRMQAESKADFAELKAHLAQINSGGPK